MIRTILLVTLVVLVVGGMFVYQHNRVDTLEDESSSRPAKGDYGSVETTCIQYGEGAENVSLRQYDCRWLRD